jgi:hypothetical protein
MKTLIKTLSILAIGGLVAGSAMAGPQSLNPKFGGSAALALQKKAKAESVQIALFRASSGEKAVVVTKQLPSANPKTHTTRTIQVTGRMSPRY